MAGSEIELETRTMPRENGLSDHGSFVERSVEENDIAPVNAVSLPPVDTGFGAWAYLASAFFLELIVWTYPFSYGVFLNYYNTKVYHGASSSVLAVAGSVGSGLLYLTSVVILLFVNRYPWYKRHVMVFGLVMAVAGLVGAAYSTQPWQLVLTQGIMYSLGGSLLYFPMSTWMFEWFSAKKGLVGLLPLFFARLSLSSEKAAGIIFSGTGVGGVVMPIIVERLLDANGPKTTLLAMVNTDVLADQDII
ncbi:hypothetical protein VNI00_008594 [Paramarasmius palmivorus]|uniref:Uncharacterized protein n=1 Tax=Paramarasmius palmivorus TaxID=297713 RepID=A0AAW0CVS8_9AGAR